MFLLNDICNSQLIAVFALHFHFFFEPDLLLSILILDGNLRCFVIGLINKPKDLLFEL
jgi:hypothetical protein